MIEAGDEMAICAAAISECTGIPKDKLLRCAQGADPEAVYTIEERKALTAYAVWAKESRRIKRIWAEVRHRHHLAREVFDRVMNAMPEGMYMAQIRGSKSSDHDTPGAVPEHKQEGGTDHGSTRDGRETGGIDASGSA